MEIRKLTANDYDGLLDLLNGVFANKYKRAMDFLSEQPKMWVHDEEHMNKHVGVFEDGRLVSVVGIYPLHLNILGKELLFATTGNVATLPEYEGRGYFTKLFSIAMEEIGKMGVDAARLGGARQRYARFGFEPAGLSYRLEFCQDNRKRYFLDRGEDVSFKRVMREDEDALSYIDSLVKKKDFYVKRDGLDDLYRALGTKHSACYLALRKSEPIGYLCAVCDNQFVGVGEFGRNITEYGYETAEDLFDILCAYQRTVGQTLILTVAPHEVEILEVLSDGCEYCTLTSPSRFRVENYEAIADALMKLKAKSEGLPFGEVTLGIEGYGSLRLYSNEAGAGATLSDITPTTCVTKAEATRLLFGPFSPTVTKKVSDELKAFLPLPLSWNTLDYV